MAQPETKKLKGERWTANFRGTYWDLRYYEAGSRRKHRIPQQVQAVRDAKRYIDVYLKERLRIDRGTGEPALTERRTLNSRITFQQFGELWTSGYLSDVSERIDPKRSAKTDASRLEKHVYPVIGQIQVRAFQGEQGVEWAESVLKRLRTLEKPPSRSTARQVAQVVSRLLTMAAFPDIKLIPSSPLARGYIPPASKTKKAKSYLYPEEEALVMANTNVPLKLRVFYGFMIREGARLSNFLELRFSQLDLKRGIITLDDTKTGTPIEWDLTPGTTNALLIYRDLFVKPENRGDYVFLDKDGKLRIDGKVLHPSKMALTLRQHLRESGIDRPQLFDHGEHRINFRVHDLRTSFVTVKLAIGKSETWVMDRTGHESSQMLQTYRKKERLHIGTGLGDYVPLDEAIPELLRTRVEH